MYLLLISIDFHRILNNFDKFAKLYRSASYKKETNNNKENNDEVVYRTRPEERIA